MSEPFVPKYNKPDAPGIHMNFDNTVALYQVVTPRVTFDQAVQEAFALVREAQKRYPDWPRLYYVDIDGHRDEFGRFDDDFVEFQQDFMFATIAHFVCALDLPLTGPLLNPNEQRNDLPDELVVGPPSAN
jgi:hypothetical protein